MSIIASIVKGFVALTGIVGGVFFSTGCEDGKNGVNSLTTTTVITAGGACGEYTGVLIQTGQDKNNNGNLDEGEIDARYTQTLCGQRIDGAVSLVTQTEVSNGDLICPFGGVQVNSGLDDNDNGVLEVEEVQYSTKVCNGHDGFSSQTRIVDVPLETKGCTFGGKEIQVGLDLDRSGTLDSNEVTSTSVICAVQVNANKTLVKNSVINPGATCTDGGILTEVGIDDNNNDILEAGEVDSSTPRCNQVQLISGVNSLVRTTAATPAQCSFGGFVFRSGLDYNYNNYLDVGEVSSNELVCNGVHGYDALVDATAYNGTYCGPSGGVKYESGLDLDYDGYLDLSEVDNISYICHGDDGYAYDGYNSLIETYDAGSACGADGGIYVESGLDLDYDGILDYSEIQNSDVICNGLPGFNSLVNTYEDTYYCTYGGLVIETGLDLDEDGYLDAGEIENTNYICY